MYLGWVAPVHFQQVFLVSSFFLYILFVFLFLPFVSQHAERDSRTPALDGSGFTNRSRVGVTRSLDLVGQTSSELIAASLVRGKVWSDSVESAVSGNVSCCLNNIVVISLPNHRNQEIPKSHFQSMNEEQEARLLRISSLFLPPEGVRLSYGTAGFRADASLLRSTMYRVGILASLRSLKTESVIGLMITASHNRESDNGVKIADPSGGMLTPEWEPFADALANAPSSENLILLITEFIKKEKISLSGAKAAEILVGRDTRPSGESLLDAAKQGISSIVGAYASDLGVLTTPQLHWMVHLKNMGMEASEHDYFKQLSSSFRCLVDLIPSGSKHTKVDDKLIVDGANGVGGHKLKILQKMINNLVYEIRNAGEGEGELNDGVGADYVQKEKVAPCNFGPQDIGLRCASLDGDADRLVYFTMHSDCSNKIDLVDGDKILTLFATFIKEQLSILELGDGNQELNSTYKPHLGIVQTAYANGASTKYLKELGLKVELTPTGVKYLHEKAADFDIGIYFEANGHGTILFSKFFLRWLERRNNELCNVFKGSEQQKAVLRLLAVSKLINQAVGDALSGMLLVEAILQYRQWSICKWNELYQDLPSRQLKVKVPDRTAVVTTNAETMVAKPLGIQEAINIETAKHPQGRSFIRPSGTEDVIRVYAEAETQEGADELANSVATLISKFLG